MGTLISDEESGPSILLRYTSDNESTDRVIPASPEEIREHRESQRQPPQSPPTPQPPPAPLVIVTPATTPIDDDEAQPSILVRYNSDNESPDKVFPADPRLVHEHSDTQHQPPQPPAPPASPISGVTTPSTTTLPDFSDFERAPTPEPTFDSPAPVFPTLNRHRDIPELPLEIAVGGEPRVQGGGDPNSGETDFATILGSKSSLKDFQYHLGSNAEIDPHMLSKILLESATREERDPEWGISLEAYEYLKWDNNEKDEKTQLLTLIKGLEREQQQAISSRGYGWKWLYRTKRFLSAIKKALLNFHKRIMEWALAYSGRPSDRGKLNRQRQGPSRTEIEMKEAEDYVNGNMHIPLEELAAQNKQFQIEKSLEYHEKRLRKPPQLEDQPRAPNGRIIFTQEYMDFMTYQDMRPLIDLRVLQHTAVLIDRRIKERDEALKLAEEEKLRAEKEGPPTSATTSTA